MWNIYRLLNLTNFKMQLFHKMQLRKCNNVFWGTNLYNKCLCHWGKGPFPSPHFSGKKMVFKKCERGLFCFVFSDVHVPKKRRKNEEKRKNEELLRWAYAFSRKKITSSDYGKKNGKIFFGFYWLLVYFFVIKPHSSLYNHLYVHFRIFTVFYVNRSYNTGLSFSSSFRNFSFLPRSLRHVFVFSLSLRRSFGLFSFPRISSDFLAQTRKSDGIRKNNVSKFLARVLVSTVVHFCFGQGSICFFQKTVAHRIILHQLLSATLGRWGVCRLAMVQTQDSAP